MRIISVSLPKQRQLTLGSFGFTKQIVHRGKRTKIKIENVANEENLLKIHCPKCDKKFVNQQGLSVHLLCVHPTAKHWSDEKQRILSEPAIESVVQYVLKRTVAVVVKNVEKSEVDDVVKNILKETVDAVVKKLSLTGRGKHKRRSYSAAYKLEAIQEVESGRKPDEVALQFGVHRTLVIKWVKDKVKIETVASSEFKEHLKIRPARKYKLLFAELLKDARRRGHRVDFNWIWSKARIIQRKQTDDPDAIIRQHVVVNFIKRNNIKMRARQRNKPMPKAELEQKLKEWHATTRERLIRTGFNDNYDDKWGRFTPEQRFNVDQSPCPFALNPKRTYHLFEDGVNQQQDKVWIAQPGSGLDKRQCSLQVCVRPVGSQPRLGIIFQGKGKRISDAERNSYHKSVDVFFQENAWADTRTSVEWVGRTLNPCVEELDRYVLYCDNLTAQTSVAQWLSASKIFRQLC